MASTSNNSIASFDEKIKNARQKLQTLRSHGMEEHKKQLATKLEIINRHEKIKSRLTKLVGSVTSCTTRMNDNHISISGNFGVASGSLREYTEAINRGRMKDGLVHVPPYVVNLESKLAHCLHRMGNLHIQKTLAGRHYTRLIKREEAIVDEQHIHSCNFEKECLRQIFIVHSTITSLERFQQQAQEEAMRFQHLLVQQQPDKQKEQETQIR